MSFVQPVAIELCNLVFPVQLPFGEHMFFQRMMGFEYHHGGGGFKPYTTFYPNNRIAHMNIPAYAIRAGNGLQILYRF